MGPRMTMGLSPGGDGLDEVAVEDGGLAVDAEHGGDVGAVDVGVDEADLVAEARERDGEVDRHGGLADAALAATDCNDMFDSAKRKWSGWCCCVSVCHVMPQRSEWCMVNRE
jgi:hypothetical protein